MCECAKGLVGAQYSERTTSVAPEACGSAYVWSMVTRTPLVSLSNDHESNKTLEPACSPYVAYFDTKC